MRFKIIVAERLNEDGCRQIAEGLTLFDYVPRCNGSLFAAMGRKEGFKLSTIEMIGFELHLVSRLEEVSAAGIDRIFFNSEVSFLQ